VASAKLGPVLLTQVNDKELALAHTGDDEKPDLEISP